MKRVWCLQDKCNENYERYKVVNNEVKRAVIRAKKQAVGRWEEKLVEEFSLNKKMFWREVKTVRKGMEVKECVKDGDGHVLTNGIKVCDRGKEYFDGILNVSESGRGEISARPRHWWPSGESIRLSICRPVFESCCRRLYLFVQDDDLQ